MGKKVSYTTNYREFALAMQIKKARPNGMWYEDESLHKWAKTHLKLKGSYNTIKKYVNILLKKGAFKKQGKHLQLLSYKELLVLLDVDFHCKNRRINQILREKNILDMTLPQAADWVCQMMILYHFRGQQYHINKKKEVLETARFIVSGTSKKSENSHKSVVSMAKKAAKLGVSTKEYAKSLLTMSGDVSIRTGCGAMGNILGISHTKANKLLNNSTKDGFINRSVVQVRHLLPITPNSAETLKGMGCLAYPSRKYNYWLEVIGSTITLPEKGCLYVERNVTSNRPTVTYKHYSSK